MENQNHDVLPEDLDFFLGVGGGPRLPKFTILEVDNSKEEVQIAGRTEKVEVLNNRGGFVRVDKGQDGQYTRTPFATQFTGIILSVRAYLQEKWDPNTDSTWFTREFRPLDTEEIIPVFKGKMKIFEGTYQQIKEKNSKLNSAGDAVNQFDYWVVIYVFVKYGENEEIMRLKVKGTGRTNFFDYIDMLQTNGKQLRSFETLFSTDKIIGQKVPYYAAKFTVGKEIDRQFADKLAMDLYRQLGGYEQQKMLAAPQAKQALPAGEKKEAVTMDDVDDAFEKARIEDEETSGELPVYEA